LYICQVNSIRRLDTLEEGEESIIMALDNNQMTSKLISMGVFPHARVKLISQSYFDRLIFVHIGSLHIALSPREAHSIIISPYPTPNESD
jgi:Fe2+ transport system protein FeoA